MGCVKEPLLQLVRRKQVDREKLGHVYVYFSREPSRRREQQLRRERQEGQWEGEPAQQAVWSEEREAAIILFFSLLDERQLRLYAGLEAHRLGHRGDRKIADFLALDVHTVARGRRAQTRGTKKRPR